MGKLYVVGLGPGRAKHITKETWELLQGSFPLYLRTAIHPTVIALEESHITYTSFDYLYEQEESFALLYEKIANILVEKSKIETLVYAVPGSPMVAERTVQILLNKAQAGLVDLHIVPAMSFLEVLYSAVHIDPAEGLYIVDAKEIGQLPRNVEIPILVTQLYNQRIASDVKLALMDLYEDEQPVFLVYHLSLPEERIEEIPLYELDRHNYVDHLTSLVIKNPKPRREELGFCDSVWVEEQDEEKREEVEEILRNSTRIESLRKVVKMLRGPQGCPWDKEQTHETLRRYLLEETHEAIQAINREDMENLEEELGDLLLQVVFHASLAEEKQIFSLEDVISGVVKKMISRHPHVFDGLTLTDVADVNRTWEEIKQKEKENKKSFLLDKVGNGFPALLEGQKLQESAAKVGFDWDSVDGAWTKFEEELQEFKQAIKEKSEKNMENEGGDLLFSLLNVLRWYTIIGENALIRTNDKFRKRFTYVESRIREMGLEWKDVSLQEMDSFWEAAKEEE